MRELGAVVLTLEGSNGGAMLHWSFISCLRPMTRIVVRISPLGKLQTMGRACAASKASLCRVVMIEIVKYTHSRSSGHIRYLRLIFMVGPKLLAGCIAWRQETWDCHFICEILQT